MNIPRFNAEDAEKYRARKYRRMQLLKPFSLCRSLSVLCAKTFSHVKKTFIPCNLLHDFIVDYRMKF